MKFLYIISFLPNILILFFFKKFVDKINIFDEPDQIRKIHSKKVPIIGGIVIFINILTLLILEFIFQNFSIFSLNLYGLDQFLLLIFVLIFLFSIGLFDDAYNLNANYRILFLIFIISLLLFFNPQASTKYLLFNSIGFELNINRLYFLVFLLTYLSFIISSNMYDGINLQSLSYYIFINLFLISKGIAVEFNLFLTISLIFLSFYNYKDKLFIGESGVYLLSFIFLFQTLTNYNLGNIELEEIMLITFIPIIDSVRLFFFRIIRGINPFIGDRNHIHHILSKKFGYKMTIIILNLLVFVPVITIQIFPNYAFLFLIVNLIIYVYLIKSFSTNEK